MSDTLSAGSNLVQVEDLVFSYPGAPSPTLRGLSFGLGPGDIYGFLGPSGAGKSTTQKILYRLLAGYHGSVQLAGKEIAEWGPDVYAGMGIGFETPNLYLKLSGRENLEFAAALHAAAAAPGSRRRHQRKHQHQHGNADFRSGAYIEAAADRLGLLDAIDNRVETYSKGMRMRLSFIRAVLHKPQLLFLDEPTSGLDPLWSRQLKDWILELRSQGTAVFLTTHSMELADELCDTVGFLVDGRLVAQENPGRLKQRYGSPGIVVQGFDGDGSTLERVLSYEELRAGNSLANFASVNRVLSQELSLEQVFLQLTGRSLQNHTTKASA